MNILEIFKNEPLIGLAPMDGVTDAAYRYIHTKYGNPDFVMTEFTNVIGLSMGVERLFEDQLYSNLERPIIAQIYGSTPEDFYHAAKIIAALKFDGIDINMGCPAKNVASSGAGAALIETPELAKEIVRQTKKGVKDFFETGELTGLGEKVTTLIEQANQNRATNLNYPEQDEPVKVQRLKLPTEYDEERAKNFTVSVKTRIGFKENVVTDWMQHLTEVEPDWIAVHGRTLKQMYLGHSDWDALAEAVEATHLPVLGNGDVTSSNKAVEMLRHTKARGVLVGRGSFGNPWIFKNKDRIKRLQTDIEDYSPELPVLLKVMQEHADLHWALKEPGAFVQIRKNLAWYIKGIHNAATYRNQLVRVNNPEEVREIVKEILANLNF